MYAFCKIKMKKKVGFTLIEVIIVLIILSTGIITAVEVIRYGLNFMDKTRKKVIAINLAREGMEWMYNIRDTNFKRWAGLKDKCWLKADPLEDDDGNCSNDPWIQPWSRVITQSNTVDKYWLLTGKTNIALNLKDWINPADNHFALCLTSNWWEACPDTVDNFTKEWRFFREVSVKWLLDKRNNAYLTSCSDGDIPGCGDALPKELIFCVNVGYKGRLWGKEQICGSMTNF